MPRRSLRRGIGPNYRTPDPVLQGEHAILHALPHVELRGHGAVPVALHDTDPDIAPARLCRIQALIGQRDHIFPAHPAFVVGQLRLERGDAFRRGSGRGLAVGWQGKERQQAQGVDRSG